MGQREPARSFTDIPVEIILQILNQLNFTELKNTESVSNYIRKIIVNHSLYWKLYTKLGYENLSLKFYGNFLFDVQPKMISKFYKKKLYQYYHPDKFNCLHCYLIQGKYI